MQISVMWEFQGSNPTGGKYFLFIFFLIIFTFYFFLKFSHCSSVLKFRIYMIWTKISKIIPVKGCFAIRIVFSHFENFWNWTVNFSDILFLFCFRYKLKKKLYIHHQEFSQRLLTCVKWNTKKMHFLFCMVIKWLFKRIESVFIHYIMNWFSEISHMLDKLSKYGLNLLITKM